jgi:hypothetical protein
MSKYRCNYSKKQIETIVNFAKDKMVVHSGPFGVGKTRCLVEAFGIYCMRLQELGTVGLTFILAGKTQQSVKRNMCNVLNGLFGNDFEYHKGNKDGLDRDAILFGQNIYIIGFNDSSSREKFQGLSDIMGILHDECTLCKQEQFDYAIGRLRGVINSDSSVDEDDEDAEYIDIDDNNEILGEKKIALPEGTTTMWYVGSCNPDAPNHFIKRYIDDNILKNVRWYCEDAIWSGAKAMYDRLRKLYRNNVAFLSRYVNGEWTSSDRMVYPMFNPKQHIIHYECDERTNYESMKRNFIAVDYGSDHPTAILLISLTYSDEYVVNKEKKLERTAVSDIVIEIGKFIDYLASMHCGYHTVYVDPAAATLKDEMRKNGIKYQDALNRHDAGIDCIRNRLSLNSLFIVDECENLLDEMYSYSFKENNENSGKDEVIKIKDDFCDAMRYGVYTDSVIGSQL